MDDTDVKFKRLFALPLNNILSFFQKKKIRPSGPWTDVWQEEHNKAFVVANVAQADYLQELYDAVEKAIREGIPFSQFKKEIKKLPEEWKKRRLPTIYNTNLNVAYSRGRYESMIANAKYRPFWRYKCQFLPGSRDEHKALHGKIFRYDDPIWQTMFPPNGWGCKCEVEPLTAEDVESQGLTVEDSRANLEKVEQPIRDGEVQEVTGYRNTETGETAAPEAGWNYNPGIKDYKPDLRKYNSIIADNLRLNFNMVELNLPLIKGKHTIEDDLIAVNPGFPNITGSRENCFSAVVAYEARRRGLNVEAILSAKPIKASINLDAYQDLQFKSFASKADIEKEMKEFGDGARMEILADWGNNKSHVFIAEQIDGKTHFFDPQNRRKDCDDYFEKTKHILAVRIDNALFSDKVKDFVQIAK